MVSQEWPEWNSSYAIFFHVDKSEQSYRDAAEALPKLLRSLFGKKGVIKVIPPNASDLEKAIA